MGRGGRRGRRHRGRPGGRFARLALSPYVLEFLAGVGIARVAVPLTSRTAAVVSVVAACWLGAGMWLGHHPDPGALATTPGPRVLVFGPPAALLVFAAVGRELGGWRVTTRWLLAAGDASYSIYLIHGLAIFCVLFLTMRVGLGHSRAPHLLWLGLTLTASVAAGWWLHVLVERPLLRLAKPARPAGPPPEVVPAATRRAA